MPDYLLHLAPWLFSCFLIGAATGALAARAPGKRALTRRASGKRASRQRMARWLVWAILAFSAGLLVARLGVLRGWAGAALESALAFFVSFLIGAAAASFAARHSWRRHEGWALGLAPAALIWVVSTYVATPAYERALRQRAEALVAKAGEDPAGLSIAGRDLTLPAPVRANAGLVRELQDLDGVRKLVDSPGDAGVAPRVDNAPAGEPTDKPRPAEPRAVLAALPAGEWSLADCEAALTATTIVDPIAFRGKSAIVRRDAAFALDKAAAFIRRCPDVAIEIIGRADSVGGEEENSNLSLRRAEAAARYLRREGVAGRRLIVAGYGALLPIASNSAEEGRAQNRSISFSVKPTM